MNLLISSSSDPYRNLATEEILLKNSTEDFLFLYINRPCVVVGKHQIVQKEINSQFVHDNNILIARRLSGGGTVYHDEGNLNLSFIQSIQPGENASYRIMTQPLFNYLANNGLSIELSEKNDFLLGGKKISGSAMHIYKNRVLAHCTLLIDCNLTNLSNALKGNWERFTDKSIASRKSTVLNLSSIDKKLTQDYILKGFVDFIKNEEEICTDFSFFDKIYTQSIGELIKIKYATFDWIYGYSPKYLYHNTIYFDQRIIAYTLEIEKNIIKNVLIESEDSLTKIIRLKLNSLKGRQHNISSLREWLDSPNQTDFDIQLLASLF